MHQIDMYYVIGKRTLLIHKDNDHHIVHNSRKFFRYAFFYLFNDSTT
mgnify:CR=1 FL=1